MRVDGWFGGNYPSGNLRSCAPSEGNQLLEVTENLGSDYYDYRSIIETHSLNALKNTLPKDLY